MESYTNPSNNGHLLESSSGAAAEAKEPAVTVEPAAVEGATLQPRAEPRVQHIGDTTVVAEEVVAEEEEVDRTDLLSQAEAMLKSQRADGRRKARFAIVGVIIAGIVAIMAATSLSHDSKINAAKELYEKGISHRSAGRLSEAVKEFESAIDLAPEFSQAHYYLGLTYMESGDRKNMLKQHEILTKLDPKLAARLHSQAYQ